MLEIVIKCNSFKEASDALIALQVHNEHAAKSAQHQGVSVNPGPASVPHTPTMYPTNQTFGQVPQDPNAGQLQYQPQTQPQVQYQPQVQQGGQTFGGNGMTQQPQGGFGGGGGFPQQQIQQPQQGAFQTWPDVLAFQQKLVSDGKIAAHAVFPILQRYGASATSVPTPDKFPQIVAELKQLAGIQ